ncbi:MAG: fatty acyl-AMP ligase [Azospirillaceae bacterium]
MPSRAMDPVTASPKAPPARREACESFVDILRYRAAHEGDRPALEFLEDGEGKGVLWRYRDLAAHAARIAAALSARGLAGGRAVLLYEPGAEYVAAFFGALQAGVVAVTSYPPSGSRATNRVFAIVEDCRPEVILTTAAIRDTELRLRAEPWGATGVDWLATDELEMPDDPDAVPVVGDQSLAMLQYTSGSTGQPKGVMVSHANLMSNGMAAREWLGVDPERIGVSWLPPYHDMGLMGCVLQPIFDGFPVTLMAPMHFLQRPSRWLRAISDRRATATGAPNFAFDLCVDQVEEDEMEGLDLSSLEVAFCGAEPVRKQTMDRFAERFAAHGFRYAALNPCYGMAEATLIVSGKARGTAPRHRFIDSAALESNRVVDVDPGAPGARAVMSCGAVAAGVDVRIVDPDDRLSLGADEVGEIWVAGGHVALGYWQKEEETRETFDGRIQGDRRSWMRTGDLGFLADGELYVTGRIKDVIIIAGRNHYPQDIELSAQSAHEAIRPNGVAAFSVEPAEGEGSEDRLVIVAEVRRAKPGTDSDPARIREAIVGAVTAAHGIAPEAVHLGPVGTVPLTTSGKVQRRACRQGYLQGNLRRLAADKG